MDPTLTVITFIKDLKGRCPNIVMSFKVQVHNRIVGGGGPQFIVFI